MHRKRVLLVTKRPLLRELLLHLPMPRVDVIVREKLPMPSQQSETTRADIWIVDVDLLKNGVNLCQILQSSHAPSRMLMVSLDAPDIVEIRKHQVSEEDAAASLEKIILE